MDTVLEKNCLVCGKVFQKSVNCSLKNWNEKVKYCSWPCMWETKKGNSYKKGKKVGTSWNKGKTGVYSKKTLEKMSHSMKKVAKEKGFGKWMKGRTGEQAHGWKGDQVGYTALHDWVRKWKGTPEECGFCGKDGLKGQQIHWASKSFKYKRDLNDWIRLCAKCHQNYDRQNNNWGIATKKYNR